MSNILEIIYTRYYDITKKINFKLDYTLKFFMIYLKLI